MRALAVALIAGLAACSSATGPQNACAADEQGIVETNGQPDQITYSGDTTVYHYNAHPPALPNAEIFTFVAQGSSCTMQQMQF